MCISACKYFYSILDQVQNMRLCTCNSGTVCVHVLIFAGSAQILPIVACLGGIYFCFALTSPTPSRQ